MCNLYRMRSGPQAILDIARAMTSSVGNLAPGDVYPDYPAPIFRHGLDGERELALSRWGMPSSRKALFDAATKRADKLRAKGKEVDFPRLLEMKPDSGTTNVRNTTSARWKPWLEPADRCLVPFTAFSEPGRDAEGRYRPVWFRLAGDDPEPLAFFAGVHVRGWSSVRKIRTGMETIDLFAFLTTEPSEPVKAIHPKDMPVILTRAEEFDVWMRAGWDEAHALQRALPDRRARCKGAEAMGLWVTPCRSQYQEGEISVSAERLRGGSGACVGRSCGRATGYLTAGLGSAEARLRMRS